MSNKFLSAVTFDDGLAQSVTFSAIVSADLPAIAFSSLSDVDVSGVSQYAILYFSNDGKWHQLPASTGSAGFLKTPGTPGGAPFWADPLPSNLVFTTVANTFTAGAQTFAADANGLIFSTPNSFAIGAGAVATGSNSLAVGKSATATAPTSIAIGNVTAAGGTGNIAIGNSGTGTSGSGTTQIAIGWTAATSASHAIAIGFNSAAAAAESIAIGPSSVANTTGDSSATNDGAVAIGYTAAATGTRAFALGANTTASKIDSIAVGDNASCSGSFSAAFGAWCLITTDYTFGLNPAGNTKPNSGTVAVVGNSSTTFGRSMLTIALAWPTSTDASRKARAVFNAHDTAARECFRMEASGSAAMMGFFGTVAAVQQTGDIGDALVTYGLLTSPSLKVANGGTGGTKGAPKTLFDHFASQGNGTTVETDLYSDTTAAGQLAANGEKLEAEYGGTFVSSATATREVKLYFGGTVIFDTGALTLSLSSAWTMFASIIRVSSSVVRYMISFTTEGAALSAYTAVGELTGLTLANTNVLKVTGQAAGVGAATNDIVAMLGSVSWVPAA